MGKDKPLQLFLSFRTGAPVQRASISRWVREVLSLSGIDVSTFGPGSTRSASTSAARRKGASPDQIVRQGDWSNLGTYQRFYDRELADTPVGRLILASDDCEYDFCCLYCQGFLFFAIVCLNLA